MKPSYLSNELLADFIRQSLLEDVGEGDHATLASVPENVQGRAHLLIKEDAVIAGLELALDIFKFYDPSLNVSFHVKDGDLVKRGDVAFIVEGKARSILTTERLVLNCLQRMSGIATKTKRLTNLIKDTGTQLLDTRKTTPNFRLIEKWAVLIGGGTNHRIGLFDMIMLKDNHIDIAGGVGQAIIRTKDYLRAKNRDIKIEIETRTLKEVEEVIRVGGVDIVMLDNMNLGEIKEAVKLIGGRFKTEASGNINEKTIRGVAAAGVDFISVGELTHTIQSVDMSLKIISTK